MPVQREAPPEDRGGERASPPQGEPRGEEDPSPAVPAAHRPGRAVAAGESDGLHLVRHAFRLVRFTGPVEEAPNELDRPLEGSVHVVRRPDGRVPDVSGLVVHGGSVGDRRKVDPPAEEPLLPWA